MKITNYKFQLTREESNSKLAGDQFIALNIGVNKQETTQGSKLKTDDSKLKILHPKIIPSLKKYLLIDQLPIFQPIN